MLQSKVLIRNAILIGIAAAIGHAIGLALGLPRDYWIVIPIILAVRPKPSMSITFTLMMVIGTVIGAMIAAALTLDSSNRYLLLAFLFFFSVMVFATRGVNPLLAQIFLVPFVIILLDIYFPGQWYLPFIRILNVTIGGMIAVATSYFISVLSGSEFLSGKNRTP
jgi:uncharacterized membrane protein YccC